MVERLAGAAFDCMCRIFVVFSCGGNFILFVAELALSFESKWIWMRRYRPSQAVLLWGSVHKSDSDWKHILFFSWPNRFMKVDVVFFGVQINSQCLSFSSLVNSNVFLLVLLGSYVCNVGLCMSLWGHCFFLVSKATFNVIQRNRNVPWDVWHKLHIEKYGRIPPENLAY